MGCGADPATIGVAFACVIGAGASTVLGALIVFFTPLRSAVALGGALSLAAGVMLYVSFVDIFSANSIVSFEDAGYSSSASLTYATLCFFAGLPVTLLLEWVADWLLERTSPLHAAHACEDCCDVDVEAKGCDGECCAAGTGGADGKASIVSAKAKAAADDGFDVPDCDCCAERQVVVVPVHNASLHGGKGLDDAQAGCVRTAPAVPASCDTCADGKCCTKVARWFSPRRLLAAWNGSSSRTTSGSSGDSLPKGAAVAALPSQTSMSARADVDPLVAAESRNLTRMGLLTGLAIALHNAPEGLITFIGYMSSPGTGAGIAVAIALHNIPEGMVVAAPVYYATGSRSKAIFWAAMSGVTEPLAGLLGLAIVCGGGMSSLTFGILFGIISGIMVFIVLKDLYPKAMQFDPQDKMRTSCMALGMAIIASSLIAISYLA